MLFILEFGLSLFSPYKSYSERNGSKFYYSPYFSGAPKPFAPSSSIADEKIEFNYIHQFNNLGFQDRNTTAKKFKAFILGDSFVQGVGTDSLHAIDKLLENQLNCDNCILSLGQSGSDLINHYKILENVIEKGYSANYVLLNLNSTDINEIIIRSKEYKEIKVQSKPLIFQFLYGYSYIFRHISHNILRLNWNFLTTKEQEKLLPEIYSLILEYLKKYKDFCDDQNIKFIVVFQPTAIECKTKIYQLQYIANQISEEKRIPIVNLNSCFNENCEAYFWPIDGHFNTEGYILYSKKLYQELVSIDPCFIP